MKYEIQYEDGRKITVEAASTLEIVKKYDLCTRENIETKIIRL